MGKGKLPHFGGLGADGYGFGRSQVIVSQQFNVGDRRAKANEVDTHRSAEMDGCK